MPIVSPFAYIKPIHHAYKHHSSCVFGLLVGSYSDNHPTITDSIPVSHQNKGNLIRPIHEIIFQIIEQELSKKGEEIVGIYFGDNFMENNEETKDEEEESNGLSVQNLPKSVQSFLARLGAFQSASSRKIIVWMIDNNKLFGSSGNNQFILDNCSYISCFEIGFAFQFNKQFF